MSAELSEEQKELVYKIASAKGLDDFELETSSGSEKGDNYLGIITKITLKNNDGSKLELILKSASPSEAVRKMTPVRRAYFREIHIYERVFVEFDKFQNEFNIPDPFSGHAKYYGSSMEEGKEWLMMENITENGYSMWNRKKVMTDEYIAAVLKEYARFHAISLAMDQKKPYLYKELTKDIEENIYNPDEPNDNLVTFFTSVFQGGYKAVADQPQMVNNLKKIEDSFFKQIKVERKECKIVIIHGDNWCNNLMFKPEISEGKKLLKVCVLDWQLTKKGSPADDLTYFFLAHSPKEILYDYAKYLKLYHDTLSKNLKDFGCDPEEVFPYSLLEKHWKLFIHFRLITCLTVIKMMCTDSDEAVNLSEAADAGEDLAQSFSRNFRNVDEYNQRIKDIMQFMEDFDFIDIDYNNITL